MTKITKAFSKLPKYPLKKQPEYFQKLLKDKPPTPHPPPPPKKKKKNF